MINNIFAEYDKLILGLPIGYSAIVSLVILLLIIWSLWRFIKGNFIWIAAIIILIPAVRPAAISLGRTLLYIGEFLIAHIKL